MHTQIKIFDLMKKRGEICRSDIIFLDGFTQQKASRIFLLLKKRVDVSVVKRIEMRSNGREYLVEYICLKK